MNASSPGQCAGFFNSRGCTMAYAGFRLSAWGSRRVHDGPATAPAVLLLIPRLIFGLILRIFLFAIKGCVVFSLLFTMECWTAPGLHPWTETRNQRVQRLPANFVKTNPTWPTRPLQNIAVCNACAEK